MQENFADLTLIEALHKKKDDIARNRQAVEKQMFKNIAYLYGKQHFIINRRGGNTLRDKIWFAFEKIEASKKERKVSNKILVYYRSLLSRLLKMRATNTVEPLTRMKRDVDAAKIAEEVLEDIWNNVNRNNPYVSEHLSGMQMVQKYLYQYMLALGSGYLIPEFNPKIKVKALVDGQIQDIAAGEVEVRVAHPLNVYKDPLNRYLIEREVMSLDEVYYRWGVDVEPEEPELPQTQQQLLTLIDKTDYTELKDATTIYRYYQHPNKDFPNGRIVIYTNKKIIQDIDLPAETKGKIPYFEFQWFDLLLSPTTKQGIVEQLMPLQDEYNFTISRIAEYKKHFGGKIFVPDGANLQTKFHNAIGQIIKYVAGREPKFVIPPNPPQYLFTDLERIEKDMQDIAMTHDPTIAEAPPGIRSGVGLQALTEKDDFTLTPTTMEIEEKFAHFNDMILDIVAERYDVYRIISIAGVTPAGGTPEIKSFLGEDVKGNRRIKTSLGSALPHSRTARQQYLIGLVQAGIISPQEAKAHLEMGDVAGALDNVDERLAKEEIQEILKGGTPVPQEWQDHKVFVDVVRKFMTDPSFKELPKDVRMVMVAYYRQHQEMLQQEIQAAMQMQAGQGQQPQPVAVQ